MAIAPVVISFLAKGMPQVQQAFKSIQDAAIKSEKAQVVAAEKAGKEKEAADSKWAKKRAQIQTNAAAYAGKLARKEVEDAKKAAEDKAKAEKKAAEDKAKADKKAVEDARKERKKAVEQQKKDEKELSKSQERLRKEQEQKRKQESDQHRRRIEETKAAEKQLTDWQKKQLAERTTAEKNAARERTKAEKEADRERRRSEKAQQSQRRAFGRFLESAVGAGARGVMNGMQRSGQIAMGLATTATQLGGGFSIADSVMREQNLRKEAATISARTLLSGAGPGSEHGSAVSTEQVLSKAKAVGIAQNIDPSEVLAGVDAIAKLTGNVDRALQMIPDVAKIATATGADLSTMSGLAGNIFSANTSISNEDLQKQLRIFTKQSVVGGVEIEDFARHGSRITAAASMYGGNKEKNEATMGALAQISRQFGSASSASEATLGAQRFSTDVAKKSKTLKDTYKIDVTDGKGNLRDAESIILDMVKATNGDVTKLYGLVGDRGVRPLEGAANIFKNHGGGEKGLEAVKKEFAKYNTGVTKGEIDAANKRVLEEQKFEQSMRELRIAAGEQLLPVFKQMLPELQKLIPAFVDLAKIGIPAFTKLMQTAADLAGKFDWLLKDMAAHPVGTLIAFELTKSFASAGLPALLRGLVSEAFSNLKLPVPTPTPTPGTPPLPPGVVGPGAGALGLAGLGMLLQGAELYSVGKGAADAMSEGEKRAVEVLQMTPDKAAAEIERAKANTTTAKMAGAWLDRGTRVAMTALGPVGAAISHGNDALSEAAGVKSTNEMSKSSIADKEMLDALQRIARATETAAAAAGKTPNNSGPNGAARTTSIANR